MIIKRDSRLVEKGDVFFDLSNNFEDGLARSKEAISRGAVKVVSERDYQLPHLQKVEDVRLEFALACAKEFGNPASNLKLIGVTGTNGKTTCTHILYETLRALGKKVARIGTLGVVYGDVVKDFDMTTPDADILQSEFFEMKKRGVEYVVMEVSAHAISQKRIAGLKFEVGVLTNITQDHLDYFGTMEDYASTKLSLFTPEKVKSAVVNIDDFYGRKLYQSSSVPTVFYGVENPADVFAVKKKSDISGSEFLCNFFDNVCGIKTKLVGDYNIMNMLACLACLGCLGFDLSKISEVFSKIPPVEGRFNVINVKNRHLVIDFAHTPDGLEKVLQTARALTPNRLFCVFGCGGNRDRDKRHKMGAVAERYADAVCLTNDNPREEDEKAIVSDIESGMKKAHFVEFDRRRAIEKVFSLMRAGDIAVIAGKGAEKHQIIGKNKVPYSDFDVIYGLLKSEKLKEEYGN